MGRNFKWAVGSTRTRTTEGEGVGTGEAGARGQMEKVKLGHSCLNLDISKRVSCLRYIHVLSGAGFWGRNCVRGARRRGGNSEVSGIKKRG